MRLSNPQPVSSQPRHTETRDRRMRFRCRHLRLAEHVINLQAPSEDPSNLNEDSQQEADRVIYVRGRTGPEDCWGQVRST